MNNLWLLDFDGTLFDSEAFKRDLKGFISSIGIDRIKFDQTYQQSKNQYGSYDLFEHMEKYFSISEVNLRPKLYHYFADKDYQYPDVANFLTSTSGDHRVIFTLGSDRFQRFKIGLTSSLSGLDVLQTESAKNRELIEISKASQSKRLKFRGQDYQKIYYLDNRVEFFIADPLAGLVQIRIHRVGDYYYKDLTPEGVQEVGNLNEIIR